MRKKLVVKKNVCIRKHWNITKLIFLFLLYCFHSPVIASQHNENRLDSNSVAEEGLLQKELGYNSKDEENLITNEKDIQINNPPDFQQKRTIKGVIKDRDGQPLSGALIRVKDTQNATVTDVNGNFEFLVDNNPDIIILFSYIGTKQQEKRIGQSNFFDVVLEDQTEQLNEIVVVAYGTALKRNITGSVAGVSEFEAKETQVGNAISGLQGRIPGLWVRKINGAPGSDPQFVIRGYQSNSTSSQPLIVIDGLIIDSKDNFSLNNIAPQDIKSIEILKDAASSAIYGSRGAMGVVQITTQKGALNSKPVVRFSSYYGFVSTPLNYRLLNSQEYETIFREGRENRISEINRQIDRGGLTPGQEDNLHREITRYQNEMSALQMGASSINWLDEVIPDNAIKNDVHLSLSGGNEKSTYYFSIGRNSEDNSIGTGNFTRYNTKLAFTNQTYDWLKIRADLSVTNSATKNFTESMTVLNSAMARPDTPLEPKYNEDGTWGYYFGSQPHPLLTLKDNDNSNVSINTTGNFGADINLFKGLVWTSTLAGTISDKKQETYYSPLSYNGQWENGSYYENGARGHRITANSFFNYSIDIQKLNVVATLGYEYNENKQDGFGFYITGFPGIDGLEAPANGTAFDPWYVANNTRKLDRSESYFLRTNLAYNKKYLFGFSIRRDGTSKLAKEHRYSDFPAVSAGWIISDEAFMADLPVINLLKLRSSYGITGSITNVAMTDTRDLLKSGSYYGYPALIGSNTWGNPYLQWETTEQTNIGIDVSLLQNKISFTADWYYKYTDGMVTSEPLPSTTGGYTSRKINSGTIRNRGLDLYLNYRSDNTQAIKYEAGINININRSKVLDLPVDEQSFSAGYYGGGNTPRPRLKIGEPLGGLQVYQALGLDENGDIIYFDKNESGSIDPGDRLVVSNLQPKFTGGLNLGISWKHISLLSHISFTYGGKVYNFDEQYPRSLTLSSGVMRNMPDYALDRWTPENKNSHYPRMIVGAHGPQDETGWNDKPSTLYLFDASFLKLGKLTLSYDLPQLWTSKINVSNCSFYISGENLLTLKNKNLNMPDPEAALDSGIAQKAIPSPRSILFGIDLTF
jgi:TonB-linked SusC/RagA family outer membrane protein